MSADLRFSDNAPSVKNILCDYARLDQTILDRVGLKEKLANLPQSELRHLFEITKAVHSAAQRGDIPTLNCLVRAIETRKERLKLLHSIIMHNNNLMQRICNGQKDEVTSYIVSQLSGKKAKKHRGSYSYTLLYYATTYGWVDLAKLITDIVGPKQLAMLLRQQNDSGRTILHHAAISNQAVILQLLMNKLPQKNLSDLLQVPDEKGNTALMLSAIRGYIGCTHSLKTVVLSNKHLLEVKNNNGKTAEQLATKHGHQDVVQCLQSMKRQVNNGRRANLEAIQSDYKRTIGILRAVKRKVFETRDEHQRKEKYAREQIAKLEKELASNEREKESLKKERDGTKLKCGQLEDELERAKQGIAERALNMKALVASNATLVSALKDLTEATKERFSSKDSQYREYQSLCKQQKEAEVELENVSRQLDAARVKLAKCEDQLQQLEKLSGDKEEERKCLKQHQQYYKQKIEILEKQEEQIKEKIKECKSRVNQIKCSLGFSHSQTEQPEPAGIAAQQEELSSFVAEVPLCIHKYVEEMEDELIGEVNLDGLGEDNFKMTNPVQEECNGGIMADSSEPMAEMCSNIYQEDLVKEKEINSPYTPAHASQEDSLPELEGAEENVGIKTEVDSAMSGQEITTELEETISEPDEFHREENVPEVPPCQDFQLEYSSTAHSAVGSKNSWLYFCCCDKQKTEDREPLI